MRAMRDKQKEKLASAPTAHAKEKRANGAKERRESEKNHETYTHKEAYNEEERNYAEDQPALKTNKQHETRMKDRVDRKKGGGEQKKGQCAIHTHADTQATATRAARKRGKKCCNREKRMGMGEEANAMTYRHTHLSKERRHYTQGEGSLSGRRVS